GAPAEGSIIADTTPTYSGVAEAGSTVTVIVDSIPVGHTNAGVAGGWHFTSSAVLPHGPRTLRATATDAVGNVSPIPATRGFTVDIVPPEAPELNVPETFNAQPVIAGTAEPHSTVTIWLNGVEAGTTTAAATRLWVFSPDTELPEGRYQVKATARDVVGNVSSDSEAFRFTIVLTRRSHYGWNCATASSFPACWAVLPLALAVRRRGSSRLRLGLLVSLLASGVAGAEQRIAVLVFDSKGWPGDLPLKHSSDDVQRLEETLRLVGNVAPENIHVLSRPTSEQLLQKLEVLAHTHREASGNTFFLFYYSGHADQTYLHLPGTPLSYEELQKQLRDFPAALKVGILDACRSGGIIGKGAQPTAPFDVTLMDTLHMQGMVLLSSSGADELSQEHLTLAGSIFSHHLISGLRGAADENADHRVSLDEVYRHAYGRTLVDTLRTATGEQTPQLKVDVSGRGSIILSWLEESSATLHLPPKDWRCFVTDTLERRLIVEALANPAHELRMALAPGRYLLKCLITQKHLLMARFSLAPGEHVSASALDFEVVPPEDAYILKKGWQGSPPSWRWVAGLRGEAEMLKGSLAPALSLSAARQVDSSSPMLEFGGTVTAIVQPTPGLRLEAGLYPFLQDFPTANRVHLKVSVGTTAFFPTISIGGRLAVGLGLRLGKVHISGDLAYERFLEPAGTR
ncbi:MAG TPA: Ig-like domain-containing protein, partial [Myxococcaceae bacterium]|nr:Ig-like domain-containing protein [Myxococcaceae bacterium]